MESKNGIRTWYIYGVTGIEGMVREDGSNNTITYFFDKNTLGDVVAIRDVRGYIVGTYEYDAWGNVTSQTGDVSEINPFRYRGYYYDDETGFYYLQTRYYDPTICRFINADNYELVAELSCVAGQLNLYAYANNNPIMLTDESGEFALTAFGIWAIVGIVSAATFLGGGAQLVSNALAGETGSDLWRGVAGSALGTGANALALCLSPFTGGASFAFAALIGASVQTGVDTIETLIRDEDISLGQTALDFGVNFAVTFAGNWLGSKIVKTNSGWFKTQRFLSVFTRPYGQKILLQTVFGAGLSGTVNFIRKFDWRIINL